MDFKKKIFAAICVLAFAVSCRSVPVQESTSPLQPTERQGFAETRPNIQDRDELTIVFSKHPIQLDFRQSYFFTEAQIFTGIYEGLVSYHPFTLAPVPAVAERWVVSEDGKEWTFTLRQNARFSNGDPVRAQDFRAAWLSILEPARASPYSGLFDIIEGARDFRNGLETNPDTVGVFAPDARTLVVRLNAPAEFFLSMLCHHSFSPIHPSMIDVEDWVLPITNGPFRIESADENLIVLLRDDYYWDREHVFLNRINIRFTETAEEATRLWNSGEARWVAANVDIDALTDLSGIQINIMFATHFFYIRGETAPWNDKRVRRAMVLVLPWEEIRSPHFLPAETLIFPMTDYPRVKGITEPDFDEAKRLMAEAGFAGGKGTPELVIRLSPSPDAARVGALMAVAWKEVLGLNVRIEVIPFELYFDSLKEGGYTVASITWIGSFLDPFTFLQKWRRDSNLNNALFDDDDFEALIDRSMFEEGATRMATLVEAEQLLLNRGVVLPISHIPAFNIVDINELHGWFPNLLDIHPFKYFSFRTFRPMPGVVLAK